MSTASLLNPAMAMAGTTSGTRFLAQKKNANGSGKTINCREHQISWVKEAMKSNTLLQKGLHFNLQIHRHPGWPRLPTQAFCPRR